MVYKGSDIVELHIMLELKRLRYENDLLKQWIREGVEDIRCAVCKKRISSLSIQRMTRPILWHDRKCFQYKPRKIIKLENDFGIDIVEILKETVKKCGNIRAQCDVLGVSIPYLYSIIKKYCGDDFVEFMAKHATGKRRELYAKKVAKRKSTDSGK